MNLRAQGPRGIGTAKGAIYLADESEPVSRRVCEGEAATPPPERTGSFLNPGRLL